MTGIEAIHRYLEVMTGAGRLRATGAGPFPFVTLSRQTGAGGHTLAEALRERLEREPPGAYWAHGWQICDQRLCELVAQDPQLTVSMQSLLSEEYHSEIREFIRHFFYKDTSQQLVFMKLFETLRGFATAGKVIIVGRAGSQVTKKLNLGIHLRLVAPEPVRVQYMMKLLHQGEAQATRTVRQQDQDRARLLQAFFQVDIDDPLQYHTVWNTERVPMATIAEAVVVLIKRLGPQIDAD